MSYIIYADIEYLIKKKNRSVCKQSREFFNNKKSEKIPCGYSMSTILAFDLKEYKHTLYRGEDCMK